MNNIEAEIRSFISKEQYDSLLDFFKTNAKFLKEDFQETFYFFLIYIILPNLLGYQ
jgi:uncharacterized protein YjbK